VLRTTLSSQTAIVQEGQDTWRVSSGSAGVLGLLEIRQDAPPTTVYLMLGERCSRNCAFCTQARESQAQASALSRVTWPAFPQQEVITAITRAFQEAKILRACFQVTVSRNYVQEAKEAISALAQHCQMPIGVSIVPRDPKDVAALLDAGAERVTIALDAACERVYRETKDGSWEKTSALLELCARLYPGRMGTHLIVGLGETEREMSECIQKMADLGVSVGLFSFTPVQGTVLAQRRPPEPAQYRRVQLARWLIVKGLARAEQFEYDEHTGALLGYGLPKDRLMTLLADGEAFRTAGCPGCNRPYYNERPGGVMYNYPRPLKAEEVSHEVELLLGTLRY